MRWGVNNLGENDDQWEMKYSERMLPSFFPWADSPEIQFILFLEKLSQCIEESVVLGGAQLANAAHTAASCSPNSFPFLLLPEIALPHKVVTKTFDSGSPFWGT